MSIDKKFVFVLMPFDSSFDDVYKLGIKETVESLDTYCERVDEQIFEERILDRIYNQINKADLIVADLTDRNPNVFYETGYAHALNKKVILLTQRVDDIPFDLRHHSHIIYEGSIIKLKGELRRRLEWFLKNPEVKDVPVDNVLQFYIDGHRIEKNCRLEIERDIVDIHYAPNEYHLPMRIDIHNTSSAILELPFEVGIITGDLFDQNDRKGDHLTKISEGKFLHSSRQIKRLYPDAWTNFRIELQGRQYFSEKAIPMILKLFTPFTSTEIPITIIVQEMNNSRSRSGLPF